MVENPAEKTAMLEADIHEGLRRFCLRTGSTDAIDLRMPFAEIIEREDDLTGGEAGDDEFAQRRAGVRAFFRFLLQDGLHPAKMLKQIFAVGRGLGIEPFSAMTMEEAGLMFSETKAAHSWRVKLLSGEIKAAGMCGTKLPGQKSEAASQAYRAVQRGNTNRRKAQTKITPKNNQNEHP